MIEHQLKKAMIPNKSLFSITVLSLLLLMLVSGCLKNDLAERQEKERTVIRQYLTEHNYSDDYLTEGGIYYIEEVPGTGAAPVLGDYVVINFVGKYLETGAIRETSYDSLKQEWEAAEYYTSFLYGPVKIEYGYNIPGINEGLALMNEGGKATFIIPSDKAFNDDNPLIYEIELLKVIRDPAAHADSMITVYLANHGFDASTKLDSIWYKEVSTPDPNDTVSIKSGDEISFRFAGILIDEFRNASNDTFDTNYDLINEDPVKFVFGRTKVSSGSIMTTASGLPAGLIMALDSMRKGTHAQAVLSYKQAFGKNGLIHSKLRYTMVPVYQNVLYDIVIEDIIPAAEQ